MSDNYLVSSEHVFVCVHDLPFWLFQHKLSFVKILASFCLAVKFRRFEQFFFGKRMQNYATHTRVWFLPSLFRLFSHIFYIFLGFRFMNIVHLCTHGCVFVCLSLPGYFGCGSVTQLFIFHVAKQTKNARREGTKRDWKWWDIYIFRKAHSE